MKYEVNEEGVQALKGFAQKIEDSRDWIKVEIAKMRQVAMEYGDTLGRHHVSQLYSALDEIQGALNQSLEPTNSIIEKLNEIAEAHQKKIDDTPLKDGIFDEDTAINNLTESEYGFRLIHKSELHCGWSKDYVFLVENIPNLQALRDIISLIVANFGKLGHLSATKTLEEGYSIELPKEYETFSDFISDFTEEDFNNATDYRISCDILTQNIDHIARINNVVFTVHENLIKYFVKAERENPNPQYLYYIYYITSNRKALIKRTNGTTIFEKWDEDTGSWEYARELISKFPDPMYDFDEISFEEAVKRYPDAF